MTITNEVLEWIKNNGYHYQSHTGKRSVVLDFDKLIVEFEKNNGFIDRELNSQSDKKHTPRSALNYIEELNKECAFSMDCIQELKARLTDKTNK